VVVTASAADCCVVLVIQHCPYFKRQPSRSHVQVP
jgi:hypothetical protein